MTSKPTIDSKIDRIIETLLIRPLNTPGAYAETEKLKGAIKALLTEARIDELEQLDVESFRNCTHSVATYKFCRCMRAKQAFDQHLAQLKNKGAISE